MIGHIFGISTQGFLDLNLTDFQKGGANVTGFQLMNYTDPGVSNVIQEWLEFDSKDLKVPKKRFKVPKTNTNTVGFYVVYNMFIFLTSSHTTWCLFIYFLGVSMFLFSSTVFHYLLCCCPSSTVPVHWGSDF